MNPYLKFGLMMAVSFVVMYAAMFFNVDVFDHILLSPTRTYMTFLMITPMVVIMMGFMWGMYKNKLYNWLIIGAAVVTFVLCFIGLRQQTFVSDEQWMKAMIPHHSSAIMVSQKAHLSDPQAIKLAEEIIEAQEREIAEMRRILYRLEQED
ncbi:hypothetical protein GGR26_001853 [Lewinella marina]|uniref:DUF305 domain-containing protein n=1 Tax=Neolewinella marina TaxID=438751 RepID=A0A2G0CHN7_9BACT|nr:DUF305 domain-containing protein [Neolewinella marina]NJB86085.1 hypothetical protein [Neolewinella marina]PHK99437.1 DUF305 domain-containing protein [Neolewinella marina]